MRPSIAQRRRRRPDPVLLEREDELEAIDRLLEQPCHGCGSAAAIVGPAGIGKSSLMEAAAERARDRGLRVLRARGSEIESSFAFGLARQLFEPLLTHSEDAGRAALLAGAARLAAPILGIALDDPPPAPSDPLHAALLGLFWLLDNVAAEQPSLVLLDDFHWTDRGSAQGIAFAARRVNSTPAAIVVALRSGEGRDPARPLLSDPVTQIMRPAPLGPA